MYIVDARDTVAERKDVPQSSVGAPCPFVLSSEQFVHLAYYVEDPSKRWDGKTVRVVDEHSEGELFALVPFTNSWPKE